MKDKTPKDNLSTVKRQASGRFTDDSGTAKITDKPLPKPKLK